MTSKRIITALTAVALSSMLLAGCTTTNGPTPTPSTASPTPTATAPTSITGEAPKDEDEAIDKAKATIGLLHDVWEQVDASGGHDADLFEAVATGAMLTTAQQDAARTAEGPILNVDGENVKGQATVTGKLAFEPKTAYGQEYEGVDNGLVIVPGCLDASGRVTTTADGKPAMTNPNPRNEVEYHVIYDAKTKTWLVNDRVSLGTTC